MPTCIFIFGPPAGRPATAARPARKAIDEYRAEHAADAEARAGVILARSLLAQGQRNRAQQAIRRAMGLVKKSQDRTVRFSVRIAFPRVRAALGKPAEARAILKATLAEAMKCGFVNYQLDARLALGEIEMKSGKTSAGHGRLAILEKDATARGFLLIARKAHDATHQ